MSRYKQLTLRMQGWFQINTEDVRDVLLRHDTCSLHFPSLHAAPNPPPMPPTSCRRTVTERRSSGTKDGDRIPSTFPSLRPTDRSQRLCLKPERGERREPLCRPRELPTTAPKTIHCLAKWKMPSGSKYLLKRSLAPSNPPQSHLLRGYDRIDRDEKCKNRKQTPQHPSPVREPLDPSLCSRELP